MCTIGPQSIAILLLILLVLFISLSTTSSLLVFILAYTFIYLIHQLEIGTIPKTYSQFIIFSIPAAFGIFTLYTLNIRSIYTIYIQLLKSIFAEYI